MTNKDPHAQGSSKVRSKYTVQSLARIIGAEIIGSGEQEIVGIKPLDFANESDLSFLEPKSKKQTADLLVSAQKSSAGALLVKQHYPEISTPQIVTPNPFGAIMELSGLFYDSPRPVKGVHPQAVVDETVTLGQGVSIGAFAVLGEDVVIGDDAVIHPHVCIYKGARIGPKCVIHAGAVIREYVCLGSDCLVQNGVVVGGDGFGYVPNDELGYQRIPHIGTVVLEDRVDVGSNSTIDRATLGETRIKEGTKIDNLVMIGHNVHVGRRSVLCGQVGISGSSTVGDEVILAGQVGVADHVSIGDKVRAAAKTGVHTNVPEKTDIAGIPYVTTAEWRRGIVFLKKLPSLFQDVKRISRIVPNTPFGARSEQIQKSSPLEIEPSEE